MISDVIRSFPVRDLPNDFALVQIDCRNTAIRGFQERQSADGQNRFATLWIRGWDRRCAHRSPGVWGNAGSPLNIFHVRKFWVRRGNESEGGDVASRIYVQHVRIGIVG